MDLVVVHCSEGEVFTQTLEQNCGLVYTLDVFLICAQEEFLVTTKLLIFLMRNYNLHQGHLVVSMDVFHLRI